MKRGARKFTLDIFDDTIPDVGQAFLHLSAKDKPLGYKRVIGLRQVKVRVSRGEKTRWVLYIESLPGEPAEGIAFSVWDNPRTKKRDQFSPLL